MTIKALIPCLALIATLASPAVAQPLTDAERSAIDTAVRAALDATGSPGASIGVVRGGQIVYEQAYGIGRIEPQTPARPEMRYAIGSVSKQFTATAVMMLQEEGRLSLDDEVAKWFPQLTRANEVSIRQLLSMTSGYQDYWPQDYVFMDMQRPAPAREIMARWAGKGARLRARHQVAVQQHQLRDRGVNRGARLRRDADAVSAAAHLHAVEDDVGDRFRSRTARPE